MLDTVSANHLSLLVDILLIIKNSSSWGLPRCTCCYIDELLMHPVWLGLPALQGQSNN